MSDLPVIVPLFRTTGFRKTYFINTILFHAFTTVNLNQKFNINNTGKRKLLEPVSGIEPELV